jgi:hypothetical protein
MANVNIYQASWHHSQNGQRATADDTSMVAAAAGATSAAITTLIQNNYKVNGTYQDKNGGPSGTSDSRSVILDSTPILYHNILTSGATGILTLYRVRWHNSRHNAANTSVNDQLVLAAANSTSVALASTIQANNGDGLTVTVDSVEVLRVGILA